MVFSSIEFLFYFLPVTLVGYYLLKRWRKATNVFLSVMSLGFYAFPPKCSSVHNAFFWRTVPPLNVMFIQ